MKPVIVLAAVAVALGVTNAHSFEITKVTASKMTKAHLCSKIGGSNKKPTVTIYHSKEAGKRIRVKMFDTVSNGKYFDHGSKTVRSDGSGKTTFTHSFRPPCNTTGNSTSKYWFEATSGSSKKKIVWGQYNSASKKIF